MPFWGVRGARLCPGCVWPCLANSLFLFYILKKNEFLDKENSKESTKKREGRSSMWPSVCHGNSLAFKMAPCHFKMAPPPTSQFYSFKLEFGDRWAESIDKLCKKNEIFEWKKPRKHFTMTLGTKKSIHKSICDRFYNPSNSPWDIWSTSSVGHTPAQFWGDRNRDWNNFTKITQGRPSFFRQKENTRKMEVYLPVYSRSCKFLWGIWENVAYWLFFMLKITPLVGLQPWLK